MDWRRLAGLVVTATALCLPWHSTAGDWFNKAYVNLPTGERLTILYEKSAFSEARAIEIGPVIVKEMVASMCNGRLKKPCHGEAGYYQFLVTLNDGRPDMDWLANIDMTSKGPANNSAYVEDVFATGYPDHKFLVDDVW